MTKSLDLVGQTFGRLTVVEKLQSRQNRSWFKCQCSCGSITLAVGPAIKSGRIASCGCAKIEAAKKGLIDMTGMRFGSLTVLDRGPNRNKITRWRCRCDCGSTNLYVAVELRNGRVKSCGCKTSELIKIAKTNHGYAKTRIYQVWLGMRHRCRHPKDYAYQRYGAVGIDVCDRWYDSFTDFLADMGEPPNPRDTLDRIDVTKGYFPGNVRWADYFTQANNKSNNVRYQGKTVTEWARALGTTPPILFQRIYKQGMTVEEAVTKPIMKRKRKH